MKTRIKKTGDCEVTLTAIDPYSGDPVTWVFWVPTRGGHVRRGDAHSPDDPQVCNGLANRGPTLTASDGNDLLRLIRQEWQAYRRAAAKELERTNQ